MAGWGEMVFSSVSHDAKSSFVFALEIESGAAYEMGSLHASHSLGEKKTLLYRLGLFTAWFELKTEEMVPLKTACRMRCVSPATGIRAELPGRDLVKGDMTGTCIS